MHKTNAAGWLGEATPTQCVAYVHPMNFIKLCRTHIELWLYFVFLTYKQTKKLFEVMKKKLFLIFLIFFVTPWTLSKVAQPTSNFDVIFFFLTYKQFVFCEFFLIFSPSNFIEFCRTHRTLNSFCFSEIKKYNKLLSCILCTWLYLDFRH